MRATEKTLAEQMRLTDVSIVHRRKLLGLTDADLHLLYAAKATIDDNLETIVDEFYERQTQIDEIALLIGDLDTMRRLRMAQCNYVSNLFGGIIDMEYVNDRLRIGLVHKRIGVKPKLYLSGVDTLSDILWKHIASHSEDQAATLATLQALRKILHFDVTLVFDTYIRSLVTEVEMAVQRAESYALGLEAKVAERTQELEQLSTRDSLTGLYNRRTLHNALRRELKRAEREAATLCLVYMDVDKFKQINDTQGHLVGDKILQGVANALMQCARDTDMITRHGGDEFCAILPNTSLAAANNYCERVLAELAEKLPTVSLSIGIAETGPKNCDHVEKLLQRADKKMYESKEREGSAISL